MKQKILASIAAGLVILGGVITPAFGLLVPQLGVHYAEAQNVGNNTDPCGSSGFACSLMSAISEVIMFVPVSLATVSGMVFDYSIWNSIQSGTYTKYDQYDDSDPSSEGLVVMGWKLVRDFTNLLFIFALFVIGFTLILDLDGGEKVSMTSNPKRTLARVLMMALLVNFSFFLARSVIDVSNKFAMQFYANMNRAPQISEGTDDATKDVNSYYASHPTIHSIATRIIDQTSPQKFLLTSDGTSTLAGAGEYGKLFFLSFVAAFFCLFLVYIFISVAILFIGRTIGLYLAVIISPLAFVSYTVPFLQKQPYIGFDDWMKQFMGLAFMAPIFLFFIYIGIQFFDIPTATSAASGRMNDAATVLFKLAMVAMFFTLAKKIAKDMSGKIGDMATSVVTGAITSVATIGAAAATGGGSAALIATRQEMSRHATSISQGVIGNEKTAALQQRLGGLRNFRNLPGGRWAGAAGLATLITGSKVPGQAYAAGKEGARIGRVENFGKLRQQILAQRAAAKNNTGPATPTVTNPTTTTTTQTTNPTSTAPKTPTIGPVPKPAPLAAGAQLTLRPTTGTNPTQNKTTAATTTATTKTTTPVAQGTGPGPKPAPLAEGAQLTLRPKDSFTGDAKFDRPKDTVVEKNAAQKAESQKATGIYDRENALKGNSMNVENLTVKNLNVQSTQNAQPAKINLPSRTGNTGLSPQKQASTFLTGIQMAPHSGSKAVNYRAGDFESKDASSVFGTEENDDIMRAQLIEPKSKTPVPEPIFGSEENDDILRAQITRPEPKPKPEPIPDIDHTGVVLDNLPGDNGNFDFGGMGKKDDDEE